MHWFIAVVGVFYCLLVTWVNLNESCVKDTDEYKAEYYLPASKNVRGLMMSGTHLNCFRTGMAVEDSKGECPAESCVL